MATVIQSLGSLADYSPAWTASASYGSLTLYDRYNYAYATLYRTQPNVRTCVDFLARNVAQLGLHVFRRVSETDRQRLREHGLARTIAKPNPFTTRYRLIESLMSDLGIYWNAYWLKLKAISGSVALLRVPPALVSVAGGLAPTKYEINLGAKVLYAAPEQIVHFRGYNPESSIQGLSPLETLRRVLAEEHAMGDYREHFWRNAARMNGVIERPVEAPEWSEAARTLFTEQFEAMYAGGPNSGKTVVLEEGMSWKQTSFNAQESEYLGGRKLTREECARAYHIPLPLVGILDHATFCLPGHVPVFTSEGPKPIDQIQAGDQVWSHTGDGFRLMRVTRSSQTGVDPILRIKTQNRTLEANPTHPILVRRLVKVQGVADPKASAKVRAGQSRWHYEAQHVYVAASEIKRGDTLVALKELPEGEARRSISQMEIFGLLLGDGNVYPDRGVVSIARANDAPYMDYYREVMRKEFVSFGSRGNGRVREGVRMQPVTLVEGDRQTRFASVLTAEWLAELGLSGTAHTKRVPGWVFGTSRAERLAFLRGYLDSDGSVDKRGKVSYSSCNPDLIEDIRHLCMSLGIAVSNAYHRVGQTVLPNGQAGDVDQWTITCSDPAANRMIGSHNPRHQKRLDAGRGWDRKGKSYPFAKGRRSEPPAGCEYSRVVGIEYLLAEPVYDIEVEGTHNFVAAGLVVHNSNIREQHKHLYQDCLGPWLAMLAEEIELQLLPEFADTENVYCEFNIEEKLQGSFEEQTAALQSAVGRPWMTPDEARAKFNMPSLGGDAAELATPLNVLLGGQASPRDSAPDETGKARTKAVARRKADGTVDPTLFDLRLRHMAKWAEVLKRYFGRQYTALIGRVREDSAIETVLIDEDRWNEELTDDLLALNTATAKVWAKYVADLLEAELDEERMAAYLRAVSENSARRVNAATRDYIVDALLDEVPKDAVKQIFEHAKEVRSQSIATGGVTNAANFGSREGAKQGGLRTKTWHVNSANPRDEHAALNGETVGIDELFSNGMRWPGDPAGGAENNANCECSITFGR